MNDEYTSTSELPVLDQILTAMKDTDVVNNIVDYVLLSPTLLDVSSRATVYLLRSGLINLTDVLISLEKSGLILDILHLSLEDPDVIPGVLRISREIFEDEGIDIFEPSFHNFTVAMPVAMPVAEHSNVKRESEVLNNFMTSFKDSGLARSVIQHFVTSPELTTPSARFVGTIIRSRAISNRDLYTALRDSNVVFDVLSDIRHDHELLSAFGLKIVDLISRGVIPRELYDGGFRG